MRTRNVMWSVEHKTHEEHLPGTPVVRGKRGNIKRLEILCEKVEALQPAQKVNYQYEIISFILESYTLEILATETEESRKRDVIIKRRKPKKISL